MFYLLCLLLLVVYVVIYYNRIVSLRNKLQSASSNVDAALLMRYELIPKLSEAIRQNIQLNEDILTKLISIQVDSETSLNEFHSYMNSIKSQYPNINSLPLFLELNEQFESLEAKIYGYRRIHAAAFEKYQFALQSFPNRYLSKMLGFQ